MESLHSGLVDMTVGADHETVEPSRTTHAKKQKSKRAVSQESKASSIETGGDYEESKEMSTAPKPRGKKKKKAAPRPQPSHPEESSQ